MMIVYTEKEISTLLELVKEVREDNSNKDNPWEKNEEFYERLQEKLYIHKKHLVNSYNETDVWSS